VVSRREARFRKAREEEPQMADPRERSREAKRKVEGGATLLDVRTREEFAQGHLPGATNIPVQQLGQRLGELGPPEREVVVYCAVGGRSAAASELLRRAGFRDVLDLGAMSNWPG
jgi:phage shock protein E